MLTNGVHVVVLWKEFKPGASIFIPSVDVTETINAIKRESKRLEFQFVHKVVIENGIRGVRVWRL